MYRLIKAGIIGVGNFGEEYIKTISSLSGVELAAICDTDLLRLKDIANKYSIDNTFTDAEKMFKAVDIDFVIIATDEKTHIPLTKLALKYNKNVLLEKPITTDIKEAEELSEISKDTNLVIMPAHILRFEPGYYLLKDIVEDKEIMSLRVKRNVPYERFDLHSRTHPVFMALAHDIDQIIWNLKENPKRIFAMERKIDNLHETPGIIFGIIEMESGVLCQLESQWCLPNEYGKYLDVEFEVMYEGQGHIKYSYPGDNLYSINNGRLEQPDISLSPLLNGRLVGALKNELEYFVELVRSNRKPDVITVDDALLGIKICNALIESAQTGKIINWEDWNANN